MDLINLFDSPSNRLGINSLRIREIRRLRELIQIFINSEQYVILRRFLQLVNQTPRVNSREENQPLSNLIRRYPYLYEHCLISEDSTFEQQETVRHFQAEVQKKFEVDLSQYITYKVRRIQVLRNVSPAEANRILRPVDNPTLLSDKDLYSTVKQFIGKTDSNYTYQERAQQFLQYVNHRGNNFHNFKKDLHEYLISSIDSKYGQRQFNQRLSNHLQNILPDADDKKINDFLVVRTCSQLLNFLSCCAAKPNKQHYLYF